MAKQGTSRETGRVSLKAAAQRWLSRPNPAPGASVAEGLRSAAGTILISLRMPVEMLAVLKGFAQRRGVGYQVLLKQWLDDRIREETTKLR